jgi:general secretion pathway protein G
LKIAKKSQLGFSYVELIISIAILALIATAATPYLHNTLQRQKETELRKNLRDIRDAIDAYKRAYDTGHIQNKVRSSGYPPTLEDLVIGVPDEMDTNKRKQFFLRRIPADPMYQGTMNDPEKTWGKRSYASDIDDPKEGNDVFDVYSMSMKKGLNDIPYRQW